MIRVVKIKKPYRYIFGNKIRFRLPSNVRIVKSICLSVDNFQQLLIAYPSFVGNPSISFLKLYNYSIILNNGNDEVVVDVEGAKNHFNDKPVIIPTMILPFNQISGMMASYKTEKLVTNKNVIKNAVHHIIFKMPVSVIRDSERGAGYRDFMEYIANNMEVTLLLETE